MNYHANEIYISPILYRFYRIVNCKKKKKKMIRNILGQIRIQ